jgi:hypothetical protein
MLKHGYAANRKKRTHLCLSYLILVGFEAVGPGGRSALRIAPPDQHLAEPYQSRHQ